MKFVPRIAIGEEVSNKDIVEIFKCGNMGGMRRAKATGTLVLVSDDTKGLYRDHWENGILHYTGMGKNGDQVLHGNQNGTLYNSNMNGVEVHLFEVFQKGIYTYRGVVKLADKPYQSTQLDDGDKMRKVWMFPLKPISFSTDKLTEENMERELIRLPIDELARRIEINYGNKKTRKTQTIVYHRDLYLKELVKRIANGKCQLCGEKAPFKDKNKVPYLEEHHVKKLAEGGADELNNVVAICPNCHKKMHILGEKEDIKFLVEVAKKNEKWLERAILHGKEMSNIRMQNIISARKLVTVSAAIIQKENKIFATQRGYGEFKDMWEFPGGKIKVGETPQQALVREIKEELDTEIQVDSLFDIVEYDYPEFHLKMYCFWCTIISGKLVLKEHEDARWLAKEMLNSVNWLPADILLIEKLKTYKEE